MSIMGGCGGEGEVYERDNQYDLSHLATFLVTADLASNSRESGFCSVLPINYTAAMD